MFKPYRIQKHTNFQGGAATTLNAALESQAHRGASRATKEIEDSSGFLPIIVKELTRVAITQGLEDGIELVKGDVAATCEGYPTPSPRFRIALFNPSFDTYAATKAALETLYRRLAANGVLVSDEHRAYGWGESHAVDEFVNAHNIKLQSISWTHSPSAYFVKRQNPPR